MKALKDPAHVPLRILYVNHVSRISGGERGMVEMIAGLDRTGYAPVAVVPVPGELSETLGRLDIPVRYAPLRRLRRTGNPFLLLRYLCGMIRSARRLVELIRQENACLIHANCDTAQICCGPASRIAGIPCVWHCRDLTDHGPLGRFMFNRADAVVAVSDTVHRHLRAYAGKPGRGADGAGRIVTIRNAIDAGSFRSGKRNDRIRQELGIGPDAFVAGNIGQIVPWKRQDLFLEAASRMSCAVPESRFILVGADLFGDHPGYRRQLESTARTGPLAGRVCFAGYRHDVCDLIGAMDVVVHCADREPFGRVLLEAMSLAKPVVAVDSCGPAEIVRHGRDGILVPAGNPDIMAETVTRLALDRQYAASLGAAGRERVERDFSIGDLVDRLETVYRGLIAGARGRERN